MGPRLSTASPQDGPNAPQRLASQDFGDDWLSSEQSPALQVPSILFPTEAHNYGLSPAQPEFDAVLQVDEPQPLDLDPRIESRLGEEPS